MREGATHRGRLARSQRPACDSRLPLPGVESDAERKPSGSGPAMEMRLHQARQSGKLQLSSLSLELVPDAVFSLSMSDDSANNTKARQEIKWWTVADLTVLDLSHNSICSIPDAFEELAASLKNLNLSYNRIQGSLQPILHLNLLSVLQLDHNLLVELPAQIGDLRSLTRLDLSHNALERLPPSFCKLHALQHADLSNNKISALPEAFGTLDSLLVLRFSHNRICELPTSFGSLLALQELDLSANRLQSLPASFSKLVALRTLNLSLNAIDSAAGNCSMAVPVSALHLVELRISFNRLTRLGRWCAIPSLSLLDASNNKISLLDDSIAAVHGIKILNLENNELNDVPSLLGRIESLTQIKLNGNPMRRIRASLMAKGAHYLKKYLSSRIADDVNDPHAQADLDGRDSIARVLRDFHLSSASDLVLSSKRLTRIPPDLAALTDIASLDLSDNLITEIPESLFVKLAPTLHSLSLRHNRLGSLPSSFGGLLQLTELNFSYNRISQLPASSINLARLRYVDLSCNALTELPLAFDNMTVLEILHVEGNRLRDLRGLPISLQELHAQNNIITELPHALIELTRLQLLDLTNNNISQLPLHVAALPSLRMFRVQGNPLRAIRSSLVSSGNEALLDYIRSRIPFDSSLMKESDFLRHWRSGQSGETSVQQQRGDT